MRYLGFRGPGRLGTVLAVPALVVAALLAGLALTRGTAPPASAPPTTAPSTRSPSAPSPSGDAVEAVPEAASAPDDLPVVDYDPAPAGFPADPGTMDVDPLTEGLRPTRRIAAYDAPGGRPLAFLDPTIRGVELTLPVAQRRTGWVAVLLPSANRRLAWLPAGGWTTTDLRDQIVVERRAHRLTWYRDGVARRSWPVSLGRRGQETPLGRTFVLGRTTPTGAVYGGVDIYALGSIPDDLDAVPASLRGAHIGIHSWHHDGELGRSTTNGCVRLTRSAQRLLLAEVPPGSPVVVVDAIR
ncbi:L,D-transpeptidase [Micromonospora fluostatini]